MKRLFHICFVPVDPELHLATWKYSNFQLYLCKYNLGCAGANDMNQKVGIMFLMFEKIIPTFGFMSWAPVNTDLHLVTSKYGKCSYMCACVTQDVQGPMT
jgi:hypothetical protein